jgi:hypothetical protein
MIRVGADGHPYCDGHECGYPVSWDPCDPEDGAEGMWTCLDCGASVYAARPKPPTTEPKEPT